MYFWVSLIAILCAPYIAKIDIWITDKFDPFRYSIFDNTRTNFIVVLEGYSQRHKTAVACPSHHYLFWIQIRLRFNPIKQSADIFYRVFAMKTVIQVHKRFAISSRPAIVRVNFYDSEVVD